MTKRTLAEMKAAYAPAATSNTNGGGQRDSNYYPFWDMQFGEKAVIRFVPDLNQNNPRGFLVEKVFHNLTVNGQRTSVTCLGMFEEECPICKLSQEYYKAEDQENGKKYYKKKQHLAQALIVEDPLPADKTSGETHQGKLRYIAINYQLYNIIKEAFAGEDLESPPDDIDDGYDFIIKKTEQGKYASYTLGTKFAPRSRALTEAELSTLEESSIDLSTLLPKNPGIDKVRSQLNADVNNTSDEFDQPAASSAPKLNKPQASTQRTIEEPAPTTRSSAPAKQEAAEPAAEGGMDDVLEAIRARRQAQKAAA